MEYQAASTEAVPGPISGHVVACIEIEPLGGMIKRSPPDVARR